MLLVYMSFTGNVRNFVERTGFSSIELNPANPFIEINEPFLVVVPSYVGYINDDVIDFIDYKQNRNNLIGFVGSGNRNFNEMFCINAKELANKYQKPVIFKFEYNGTEQDIEKFKKEVKSIGISGTKY